MKQVNAINHYEKCHKLTLYIVIHPDYMRQYRFESNMPLEQHRHFNKILNEMVNKTQAREYRVNMKSIF